jgi:hypothetical protein
MGTKQSRTMTTEWPRRTDGRTEAAQASPDRARWPTAVTCPSPR